MDHKALNTLLAESTCLFRKGPVVETKGMVVEFWGMPHEDDPAYADIEKIDMVLMSVGIIKEHADNCRDDLLKLLETYPDQNRLHQGPSYIEMGAELDSQELAFRLYALGHYLKIWEVITPRSVGITGDAARDLAGKGFVFIQWCKEAGHV